MTATSGYLQIMQIMKIWNKVYLNFLCHKHKLNLTNIYGASVASCEWIQSIELVYYLLACQRRKRRQRTQFSKYQLNELEKLFQMTRYPDIYCREDLSSRISIPESRIQVWFKNRRSKIRKDEKYDYQVLDTSGSAAAGMVKGGGGYGVVGMPSFSSTSEFSGSNGGECLDDDLNDEDEDWFTFGWGFSLLFWFVFFFFLNEISYWGYRIFYIF